MPDEPCNRTDLVSLREHIEALLAAQDERNRLLHDSSDRALRIAEANNERWRQNANEWRAAMDDRERTFLPRSLGIVIAVLSIVSLLIALWGKL